MTKKPIPPEESTLYHNTERLMREYRDVVWGLELATQQIRSTFQLEYGESIEEFLDSIYLAGADLGGTEIESHARTVERTRKMVALVDNAVELLRHKHKNGEVFYWMLYYSYLSSQELDCVEDILEALEPHIKFLSRRTFYRYRKEAIQALSSVIWGYTARGSLSILKMFYPDN